MTGLDHPVDHFLPDLRVWQVEDQKVVLRRGPPDRITTLVGEFEMEWLPGMTEDHAIEPVVILESSQNLETEAVPVKGDHLLQRVRRTSQS